MYNAVVVSIFANFYKYLTQGYFYPPPKKHVPVSSLSTLSLLSALATLICSQSLRLGLVWTFPVIRTRWSFVSGCFHQQDVSKVHSEKHVLGLNSFFWLNSISLCGYPVFFHCTGKKDSHSMGPSRGSATPVGE